MRSRNNFPIGKLCPPAVNGKACQGLMEQKVTEITEEKSLFSLFWVDTLLATFMAFRLHLSFFEASAKKVDGLNYLARLFCCGISS